MIGPGTPPGRHTCRNHTIRRPHERHPGPGQARPRAAGLARAQVRPAARSPRLAAWADRALDEIYGIWERPVTIGPYHSEDAARAAKNALYEATYKRWNRAHPGEPLSLSANVTNPADGRCYARGQERCTQNGCQPTPGGYYIHARLYDKKDGRAHQGAKPRDTWDYDPLVPRPRQHRASTEGAAQPAPAGPGPGRVRRFGAAAGTPRTTRSPDPEEAAPQEQPGSLLEKVRRWA